MKFSLLFSAVAQASSSYEVQFAEWQGQFPDSHGSLDVFKLNMETIEKHNSLPHKTYTLGVNQFTGITHEEFLSTFVSSPVEAKKQHDYVRSHPNTEISLDNVADDIDWTTKGVVGPIQNQGMCGGCWAFSVAGSVEGAYAIKNGKFQGVSVQQQIDCDRAHKQLGCGGGFVEFALDWHEQWNSCSIESYPFIGGNWSQKNFQPCQAKNCTILPDSKIVSVGDNRAHAGDQDDSYILKMLNMGPVTITVDAHAEFWTSYKSGIVMGANCTWDQMDHGVLLVGAGTTTDGIKYWKVKNSWGAKWGEDGFIRLQRSYIGGGAKPPKQPGPPPQNMGTCGMNQMPFIPLYKNATN